MINQQKVILSHSTQNHIFDYFRKEEKKKKKKKGKKMKKEMEKKKKRKKQKKKKIIYQRDVHQMLVEYWVSVAYVAPALKKGHRPITC